MVTSLKFSFIVDGNNPTGVSLDLGETIHFGSVEFTVDRFDHLSFSPDERGTCSSSRTALEDSSN
jgi:hypothetical protein